MKNTIRILFVVLLGIALFQAGYARECQFGNFKSTESIKSTAAGCIDPAGFRFLQVNNVRARINTGGDMWWDLQGLGQYYIPANGTATSLFSGSLWIGGLDINNQLKLAALRYRQVGQDYWTGPLTIDGTAAIDDETCSTWDKHFYVKRADVDQYLQNTDPETGAFIPSTDYSIPDYFFEYPAHGDISKGQSFYIAPFKDADGDGLYDPTQGDYPYYDVSNELCPLNFAGDPSYVPAPTMESEYYPNYFGGILVDQVLKGDETLWWIFNDKGNVHTETEGAAIGMEIRAQAFAFSTNDEINNMSFYSYEIINRSTYVLTETYFCPWVDTDLGFAGDDYVGCDVDRGLGYCYNGRPVDGQGTPETYGEQPPAIGIDFFQGPYMDPDGYDNPSFVGDGLLGPSFDGSCEIVTSNGILRTMTYGEDNEFSGEFRVRAEGINGVNFGNGIVDDERFGMRRFVYHNNTDPIADKTDPSNAPEYYNFLRGIWKNNQRMLYGGNAYNEAGGAVGPECDFMFPGDTDPCNWGTNGQPPEAGYNTNGKYWTEEQSNNQPADRRFMQSAGPFTLLPGAVNYITVGVPWAKAISGGPWASVELLRVVDDKCQALFDNCFKLIDGPDAPDLSFRELDRAVMIYITNSPSSNNYLEEYKELDPQIRALSFEYDPYFTFEGYQIFQVKNANVTVAESRYDPDKVRLIAQFDVKNGVSKIVNYKYDNQIGGNVPVIEVEGGDNGVVHAFKIINDAFATGDNALVNFKQYYYSAIAYGHNNYKEYDPTNPLALDGQKKPYLSGRKNIQVYTAIPHKTVNGIVPGSEFGDGPQITRIEGQGNGGMRLELTDETIEEILSKPPAYLIVDEDESVGNDTVFKYNYGQDDYPISYNPVYKDGFGPVTIKVIDPLNVKKSSYTLRFDTTFTNTTFYNISNAPEVLDGGDTAGVKGSPFWWLVDNETGAVYKSEKGTAVNFESIFPELGISVTFKPVFYPGLYKIGEKAEVDQGNVNIVPFTYIVAENNGFLYSTIEYADSSKPWLSGVYDIDGNWPFNWIRSGTSINGGSVWDDYWDLDNIYDPEERYENIVGGSWSPYLLAAIDNQFPTDNPDWRIGPAFNRSSKSKGIGLNGLASVDIVFTSDKSKWTRSPVLEMCEDPILSVGNAKRFALRKSASLDKDGNPSGWPANKSVSNDPDDPNYVSASGMGWFPGYAINLETGERMNIMFGEDSYLASDNGRNMEYDPSARMVGPFPANEIVFGGKHYVYVMGSKEINDTIGTNIIRYSFPAYDAGSAIIKSYREMPVGLEDIYTQFIFYGAMYVGIPLADPKYEWLGNEAKVKIRIAKPYEKFYSTPMETDGSENNHYPMYEFSTDGIATNFYNEEKAKEDVELIAVVPNPYYASAIGSGYEEAPLQNQVKVTNLPEKCVVSIYNISGTLIRKFTKDDPVTFINWDLKNQAGIPIAGGVYLVHVKDESTGEEVIVKWFGSLRIEDFKQF